MAIADIAIEPISRAEPKGLRIERHFSREGVHPYDGVEWEVRDSTIPGESGNVFEQKGVEVPKFWSQTATNVVASKYFRGKLGSPERESSVREMVDRVVDTIARAGFEGGYFASAADRDAFADELKYLMVHQYASFNSPVWFNIGVEGVPQQASACFILSVEDDMHSILDWFRDEGIIFKGGSGSGVNVSRIRSQKENLSGGGFASGPVSFMRGADSVAGSIKSGGTTRRAAKMVVLNTDHPDVREFIWCKAKEEKKAWALGEQVYDSACNLASLNLMRFRRDDGELDTERFARAVDVVFTAQEILVGFTDYPTAKITANAKAFRQLGLGYANLGALLMDRGLAYDSDEGRGYAAAITALMTGEAYAQSARMAGVVGAYDSYALNRE